MNSQENIRVGLCVVDNFHNTYMEQVLLKKGYQVQRATAPFDEMIDVIIFDHQSFDAIQNPIQRLQEDFVTLLIEEQASGLADDFDGALLYPFDIKTFEVSLNVDSFLLFDDKTRFDIEALLGAERYGTAILEMIKEGDEVVGNWHDEEENRAQNIADIHKISGVCAMLGVKGLHEELLQIELLGKAEKINDFQESWGRFSSLWNTRKAEILASINK